jgi:hypothetical protein
VAQREAVRLIATQELRGGQVRDGHRDQSGAGVGQKASHRGQVRDARVATRLNSDAVGALQPLHFTVAAEGVAREQDFGEGHAYRGF